MKQLITLFMPLFFYMISCQTSEKNMKTFNFPSYLNSIKREVKADIKIIDSKNQDYFKGNLMRCDKNFYAGMVKNKTYYLKNGPNHIVIVEYIFDNNNSSKKASKNVKKYAEFARKLKRVDYPSRCYDIWDEQIYYAALKKDHIYLLTSLNEMNFENGNISVDDIFKESKEIEVSSLYKALEKLRN